jgi:hypothetical protein
MQDFNVHLASARKWVKPNVHVLSPGSTARDKEARGWTKAPTHPGKLPILLILSS